MNDQNLVNKPVKAERIIDLLRHVKVETGTLMCLGCGYEHHCGIHGCAIMNMAADRLANDQTHIAALQQEIEKLRSSRRWIPVTERPPEIESFGVSKVLLGIVENETGFPPPNPCFCVYLGNGKWSIRGRLATVTHWMPMPEPPEVE